MSDFATVTADGVTVTSSSETTEQLTEILTPTEPAKEAKDYEGAGGEGVEEKPTDPKLSKAAAKLGQKGGEVSAAKRAEAKAAEEAEAEGTEAEAATEEKLGKPRHDAKARMLEATRKEAEAKRELERERAERTRLAVELEQLRAGKVAPKDEPKPAAAPGKPKVEDFGTYEEYVEALTEFKADERLQRFQRESTEQARQAARHQGITKAIQTHADRFKKASEADPSFIERTAPLMTELVPSLELPRDQRGYPVGLRASHVLADSIINSEFGPALTLHLTDHPEEKQRILSLPNPEAVQMAVARLEGRLERAEAAAPAPKPEFSKAKPPVRPVPGSPHSGSEPDPDSTSFDEHLSFYNRRDQQRSARN